MPALERNATVSPVPALPAAVSPPAPASRVMDNAVCSDLAKIGFNQLAGPFLFRFSSDALPVSPDTGDLLAVFRIYKISANETVRCMIYG